MGRNHFGGDGAPDDHRNDGAAPDMNGMGRIAAGASIGAIAGAAIARLIRPLFHPPTGGVGFVTVNGYPKSWDYAVVGLLIGGAFIGGVLFRRGNVVEVEEPRRLSRRSTWIATLITFVLMLFIHDHPYLHMDPFHEGEHLTPAFVLRDGGRPFTDIFFLHGFATDGGLDALVVGDPPSPRRERRLETLLDSATLALLVPIAAEIALTPAGAICAAIAALCGVAAGQLPVFPWFRLAPVLLAAFGLLRYARLGRSRDLMLALAASTLGVLWSLDTGTYALAATVTTLIVFRIEKRRAILLGAIALALPLLLLLATGAGIRQFIIDSFVIIPQSIDAVWSLPARSTFDLESARYYLPPVFYGFLLALAVAKRNRAMFIVAIASIFVFRTAAGRCAWSHTRYGTPLFGAAVVAFVIEPLVRKRRCVAAVLASVALIAIVEVPANVIAGARLLAQWKQRQSHEGLVPYPFATGKGIYTTKQNADDLAALNGFIVPRGGTFLDVSNERALYFLFQRRPPVRCPDVNMLSNPRLFAEAMRQLKSAPPSCVVVKGNPIVGNYDGVPYDVRVPELARWIEENYPQRFQIGRFTVAAR
jgi:hypothetical protein